MYKARRYKCKFCSKVYYENNPFSTGNAQTSTYTILAVLDGYAVIQLLSLLLLLSSI